MSATKATLGGFPILGHLPVEWDFTCGVQPYQKVIELAPDNVKSLLEANKPGISASSGGSTTSSYPHTTLRIEVDGRKPLVIDYVYVLNEVPSSAPYLRAVLVSDRRWLWPKKFLTRSYNIRRRSGEYRVVGNPQLNNQDGAAALQLAITQTGVLPDIVYAPFSLKDGNTVWTVREIVDDIFTAITGGNYNTTRANFNLNQRVLEGIELEGNGDLAINQALFFLTGHDVFIDENGIAVLKHESDGSEGEEIKKAGPPIVGPPTVRLLNLDRVRPAGIEVLFSIEDELRFDYFEPEQNITSGTPALTLENVMPLPDPVLTIDGKKCNAGTWVKIDENLLSAWNDLSPPEMFPGVKFKTFDFQWLQWCWINKYSVWHEAGVTQDPIWARRLNMIQKHYRQTFRIPHYWLSRFRSIRDNRISIIDPENMQRAAADIWADWTEFPTQRRMARRGSDPGNLLSIAHNDWAALIANARPSQAKLEIIDAELGIVRANFGGDIYGGTEQIIPSAVVTRDDHLALINLASNPFGGGATPSADPRLQAALTKFAGALSPIHRLSTIFTVAQASPNNEFRFFKRLVTPNEIRDWLPNINGGFDCNGPIIQVRVGPGIESARFAWLDENSEDVRQRIINGGARDPNLLVNRESIDAVAKAVAYATYVRMTDRYEGTHAVAIDADRKPYGRIHSVSHKLSQDGSPITTLDLPPDIKPIDFWTKVPESIRRILLKQVQPPV